MRSQGGNDPWWQIVLQVFPTYLLAGCGMVGAGLILDTVQYWPAFRCIPEIMIVVPPLLGLKGNLEMTLAARMSTASNMGLLKDKQVAISTIFGNLVLVQCQGIVVGILAAFCGAALGWAPTGKLHYQHGLLLCASSIVTASLASFVLSLIMVLVIVIAGKCHCNPDNIATPIAASLGDITTLGILALISDVLYKDTLESGTGVLAHVIIGGYFLILPVFFALANYNEHVSEVLKVGWTPVLMAMLIASGGGFVLEMAVEHFRGVVLFAPVMNGSGGDLVGIQASRMTTYLNKATNSLLGTFPPEDGCRCQSPCSSLCGDIKCCSCTGDGSKQPHAMPARVLLMLLFPGHILFVMIIFTIKKLGIPSIMFLVLYLSSAALQVAVLLYLCHLLVYYMWSRGTDPDNAAIPYLTAVGDLLGTSLLAMSFFSLETMGDTSLLGLDHHGGHNSTNATEMSESMKSFLCRTGFENVTFLGDFKIT